MRLVSSSLLIAFLLVACDHPAPPAAPVVSDPVAAPPAPPAIDSAAPTAEAPPVPEAPPAGPPRGKRAPCTTDQSCNGDPSVSALWGKCNVATGTCTCNAGFELHPGGSCQPAKK